MKCWTDHFLLGSQSDLGSRSLVATAIFPPAPCFICVGQCSAWWQNGVKAARHTVTGQRQPAGQVRETARADLPVCCCAQPSAPQSPPPVPTAGLGLDSTLWSPWPVPERLFERHSFSRMPRHMVHKATHKPWREKDAQFKLAYYNKVCSLALQNNPTPIECLHTVSDS